jgi:hypothetical protein
MPAELADRYEQVTKVYQQSGEDFLFDDLEALFDDARKQKWSHPRRAEPMVSWLYEVVADVDPPSETRFENRLARLERWREQFPESPVPLVAAASVNNAWAWWIRGSGFVDTVDEEAWRPFRLKIQAAQELLEQAEKKSLKDAHLYVILLRVGRSAGADREQMEEWLAKGREIDPDCLPLYREMAVTLLPRWHGQPGDVEEFAERMFEEMPNDTGLAAYATIARTHTEFELTAVFQGSYDRKKLQQAARHSALRWPDSMAMNELAAMVAWINQDQPLAVLAKDAFGTKHVPKWWNRGLFNMSYSDLCRGQIHVLGDRNLWDFSEVHRVEFLKSGEQLLTYHLSAARARVYDVESQTLLYTLPPFTDLGLTFAKNPVRDQYVVATALGPLPNDSVHGALVVDLASDGEPVSLYNPAVGRFEKLYYSPDGNTIVADHETYITRWNSQTGTMIERIDSDNRGTLLVAPDNRRIFQLGGKLYDPDTKQWSTVKASPNSKPYRWNFVAGFVDKDTLVGHADLGPRSGFVAKWNIATGEIEEVVEAPSSITHICLSPGGRLVAIVNQMKIPRQVHLIDVNAKKELNILGPFGSINDVAFSPDGSRLAVACGDCGIRIFDLRPSAEPSQ